MGWVVLWRRRTGAPPCHPPAARPLLEEALRPGAVSEALEALQAGSGCGKGNTVMQGGANPLARRGLLPFPSV